MSGETLEFLALLAGLLLAYGIKRIIDKGVMTLLTPLLDRCHLTSLVNRVSRRSDTPDSEGDTPTDTPPDTVLGDDVLRIGHDRTTTIRIPTMVRIGEPGSPDGPPLPTSGPEKASPEAIRSWVRLRHSEGRTRAQILTEGQEIYGVSESTMVRRYREAWA